MHEIRAAASSADLAEARSLFREYERWVNAPACFAGFELELAELPGEYAPPQGLLLLARYAGGVGGCAALRRLDDEAAEMKRLYVRQAARGRGIGRALAEGIIDGARCAGYRWLRLDSLPKMRDALAMYADLGFLRRGPYVSSPTPGAVFLERPL